jgi:hypothetical protein
MRLITAHRILIGTAIAMFVAYALFELREFSRSGEGLAILRGLASLAAAGGFTVYLRRLKGLPADRR